jgi:hypothetical protein
LRGPGTIVLMRTPVPDTMPDVVWADEDARTADRRRNISIIASIPGRYMLTRRLDANGNRRELSCRVVRLSPQEMVVVAPVNGTLGERVIANLMEFGRIEGTVVRAHQLGFVMSLNLTGAERERFAAKIEWYEKHKNHDVADNRKFKRIIPENPHSTVTTSNGGTIGAFIIDMSVSGVAVSADIEPKIGEPLAVGKVIGRVVRHFPGGFGVKFIDVQNPQMLERLLLCPPVQ